MVKLSALSDTELIDLLKADNGAALGEIYERYHQPVYRFLRQFLHADELSEDICQNVFIRFWEERHHPMLIANLRAWLYNKAKRQALDFIRRASREETAMGLILDAYPSNSVLADDLVAKDYLRFVETIINSLPEQTQRVFRLCRQQHKSYDEAAEILGISRNTVKKHMMRSMEILKGAAESELGISFLVLLALMARK